MSTCNPEEQLKAKIEEWLKWDKNPNTTATIKKLVEQNKTAELAKKLHSRLTFGKSK